MRHIVLLFLRHALFQSKTDAELREAVASTLDVSGVAYQRLGANSGRRGADFLIEDKHALLVTVSANGRALTHRVNRCAHHVSLRTVIVATLAHGPVHVPQQVNGRPVLVERLKSSQPGGE